ncbi:MAG: hypothetical protein A3F16_04565 [Deltaproteobacteria bacterium RIFCSPHIGHO2_12_FULL_43_9]|nr:MAG: hypothetical protein A3F16_04565 [Deltaproteobacteria bacterium RIFCSPHIGHO2_12_FULL_43_9]
MITSSRVIVDTSVFISFFRGKSEPEFEKLLLENKIVLSPYVRLELLQGIRKNELSKLEYVLEGIELIPSGEETFEECEVLLREISGKGYVFGLVDLLLAADSRIYDIPIYSYDKAFKILSDNKLIPGLLHLIH